MSFETICYGCALVGLVLTGIGRRLLFIEAASVSDGWRWAVRLLPLADIMFLAKFWDSAKTGAFTSLIGLGFLLPLGAKKMWDQKNVTQADYAEIGGQIDMDSKAAIYRDMKAELDARVEARQRKLQQLNGHMAAWYSNMTQRRAALASATPEQVAEFNAEAVAYQALHQVTKDEAAELQQMMNRQALGFSSVTDEEFGRHVSSEREQSGRNRTKPPALDSDSETLDLDESG